VSDIYRIDLGHPTILEFRGPDAARFLNGQLTQDVRRVVGGKISLPSCVTDAKGRLQFRVHILEGDDGALWVTGLAEWAENLEARLTRYLIADDVVVTNFSEQYQLSHFTGFPGEAPPRVSARESNRYGASGMDWWIPCDQAIEYPVGIAVLESDALEALRITHKAPAWGAELVEGMLPPEALLETTDISYTKGCYIGQEVISRIKSAGKVNKYLTRFAFDASTSATLGPLVNSEGQVVGEVTSVSPFVTDGLRDALGYVKRGVTAVWFRAADGKLYPVAMS
jgi:tRNA-modifying protein YgfZ